MYPYMSACVFVDIYASTNECMHVNMSVCVFVFVKGCRLSFFLSHDKAYSYENGRFFFWFFHTAGRTAMMRPF